MSGLMDIYPTVVELAGLELPEGIFFDGESLVETLFNQTERKRSVYVVACSVLCIVAGCNT